MGDMYPTLLDAATVADEVLAQADGPSHRNDPPTSRWAARRVGIRAGALKHRILRHLANRGDDGATDYELHKHCDPHGRVHSAANRRKELMDRFDPPLIATTAKTRPTDTDTEGVVHVITEAGATVLAEIEEEVTHG